MTTEERIEMYRSWSETLERSVAEGRIALGGGRAILNEMLLLCDGSCASLSHYIVNGTIRRYAKVEEDLEKLLRWVRYLRKDENFEPRGGEENDARRTSSEV